MPRPCPLVSSPACCPVADGDGFFIHPFPQKGWLGRPSIAASLVGVVSRPIRRCSGPSPTSWSLEIWTGSWFFFFFSSFVHGTGGAAGAKRHCHVTEYVSDASNVAAACCPHRTGDSPIQPEHSRIQTHGHCLAIGMGDGSVARKSSLVRRTGHTRRSRREGPLVHTSKRNVM
jgi:hypothetical protein